MKINDLQSFILNKNGFHNISWLFLNSASVLLSQQLYPSIRVVKQVAPYPDPLLRPS